MARRLEINIALPSDLPRETGRPRARHGAQPRARGDAVLTVKRRSGSSAIGDLRQSGSLRLVFPRPKSSAVDAVLVNTAGGLTGGDRFSLTAHVTEGTGLTLTTQAAERAYCAASGETARVANRLVVDRGARLNWLPQETILYRGCGLERSLLVETSPGAELLLCEPLVFGRRAMGEKLEEGMFRDRIEVRRGNDTLFLDQMTLSGDIAFHLARHTIAGDAGAMASLLFVAHDAETHLPRLRALLPETGGTSLIRDGVLYLRALAADGFALRQFLVPILAGLTGAALPRPWML